MDQVILKVSIKLLNFFHRDVLEARGDEISESTFTEETKAEDVWRILTWDLT